MFNDLIKNLIKYISFYAFSKINQQYEYITTIKKKLTNETLKICNKSFFNTMNFLCAHMIKTIMKFEKKKYCLKMYIFIDELKNRNFFI